MRTMKLLALACVTFLAACPPPPGGTTGGGGRGGGGVAISPDSCGKIDTNDTGRKLYSFLLASAELDKASLELEASIAGACRRMARALGVDEGGDTKTVCTRAATELDANLKVSVKTESRLVTKYTPAVCETKVELEAGFIAQCEGRAVADNSGASASAECRASAGIRATTRTECSEPKVEVVRENVTIVDDSKFQKAMAAIDAGMPAILRASKKLELAGEAVANWVKTGAQLVAASGKLVADVGEAGVCVAGQLIAVAAASANIQARLSVSIEVSASVSASAGARAQ
jgi:hypothetical protein